MEQIDEQSASQPEEFEPVVVQPSKRMCSILLVASAALLALGCAELVFGWLRGPWRPEVLIFLSSFLLVSMAFQWGRRIVVTRDLVIETRRGKERARAPVRSIEKLGIGWIGRTLVFEEGVRIPFNDLWENAGWLRSSFAVLADARRGGVAQEGNWLPLDFLRFPERCLGCDGKEFAPKRIFIGYRIIVGLVAVWLGEPIFVPACRSCIRRHRIAYLLSVFVALPALVAAGAGLTYAMNAAAGATAAITTGGLLLIGAMLLLPNAIPLLIDCRYLGISGVSIRSDKSKAWIRFRDPMLREEILMLTQEEQMEHLQAAAVYLKQ